MDLNNCWRGSDHRDDGLARAGRRSVQQWILWQRNPDGISGIHVATDSASDSKRHLCSSFRFSGLILAPAPHRHPRVQDRHHSNQTAIRGSFIDPSNVIYESDWRTVQSDGSTHQVNTNVELMLPPGERYLFSHPLTPGYAGPSGQLQTNRTLAMAQAGVPEHREGAFGLRALCGGIRMTGWIRQPQAPDSADSTLTATLLCDWRFRMSQNLQALSCSA